jgi:hypothetical protein
MSATLSFKIAGLIENATKQSFHNVETFVARFLQQDLDL